jgi:hypothetical protein
MYILTQNSHLQKYKAKVIDFQPLQDWKFAVKYYDDQGFLCTEVVESTKLELEEKESL